MGENMMSFVERRKIESIPVTELKKELNELQLATIESLEPFGWQIKFIRRPFNSPKVAVVFDNTTLSYGEIEIDGTLNEKHNFSVR